MTKLCNGKNHKHFLPFDSLRIEIMRKLKPGFTTNDFVKSLHDTLSVQEEYSNSFPLIGAAMLLRSLYAENAGTKKDEFEYTFWEDDLTRLISDVVSKLETQIITKYSEKGKISRQDIKVYSSIIREILRQEFIAGNKDEFSYYKLSKSRIQNLTQDLYIERYKTKIEYLAKIARAELKESIKKEL
jgi:hypothetical protein